MTIRISELEVADELLEMQASVIQDPDDQLGFDNKRAVVLSAVQSGLITDALQDAIDAEATTRADADIALGLRIDDEAVARADADIALGLRIDDTEGDITDIEGDVNDLVLEDIALNTRIDEEEIARSNADAVLQQNIDNVTGGINVKGSATVAEINALGATSAFRDTYRMLDSGTLTIGGVVVATDDLITWNESSEWVNLGDINTNTVWGDITGDITQQTDLDNALSLKADESYVDSENAAQDVEISLRATIIDSESGDAATLASANIYTDTEVATKTDEAYVDAAVAPKADTTYVDSENAAQDVEIGLRETIVKSEADDAATLASANLYTDEAVAGIDAPDLTPYETIAKSEADDAATLASANNYTVGAINELEIPVLAEDVIGGANIDIVDNGDGSITINGAEAGETLPPVWGDIEGTLSNQTDLQDALNLKSEQSDINTAVEPKANTIYVDAADADLQVQIDNITGGVNPKGEASVAEINALGSDSSIRDAYILTDSGTLTEGDVAVVTGDWVVWALGNEWVNLGQIDVTAEWGEIGGTLSDQTDLQSALNLKLEQSDLVGYATTAYADAKALEEATTASSDTRIGGFRHTLTDSGSTLNLFTS